MTTAHKARIALLVLFGSGAVACDSASARETRPKNWTPVTMEHGIKEGARLDEVSLDCGVDGSREIAPRHNVQLVTFATPYDCSSCAPHLAALDSLHAHGELPRNDVIVMWSPGSDLQREVAIVRKRTPRTVCVDPRGTLWDRHDLQHTPITMLLVDGRVTYMNDRMLGSDLEHRAFLQDLAKYEKRD